MPALARPRFLFALLLVLAGGALLLARLAPGQAATPATAALRVGTPGVSLAAMILVLGGRESLAATTVEVRNNPWLRRIMPTIAGVPVTFTRPAGVDREGLLAVRPDLVVLWRGNGPSAESLAAIGMPSLSVAYATPDEMKAAIVQLGQALGPTAAARAGALIAAYDANLRRVATGLAGLAENQRPRVYYASLTPLHTEGRDSMIDAWIRAAGGVNVAAQAGIRGDATIHLEDLLAWNPQIIVTLDAAQRRAILADARWREVEAVRQGRVYVNPRGVNAWCTRAAEATLQVLWAARTFHPERFADLDLALETRRFYQHFYNYELSDDEVARVLQGSPPPESPTPTRSRP